MVRILANGDIVQDDDPRAQQARDRASGGAGGPRMGYVRHDNDAGHQGQYGQQQQQGMMGQQVSIFTVFNQKLIDAGFPRWNLGSTVIEPIVSVGFLLAFLVFGLPGILFGALLFVVCKMSMGGGGQGQGQGQQGQGHGHYQPPGRR
ncbi:protein FAM241B-like [Amphiura filiformis]|uniref:protein FAM241B-like n=1 Tax=Amphiura filiformis TaxID=82378 RepID=UPI003B20EF25